MSKMTTEQVLAAIASLPDDFRGVATLYFVEDMTYQEMAEVLRCPAGTVRSRLHRGRKLLQQKLWALAEASGIIGELTAGAATA